MKKLLNIIFIILASLTLLALFKLNWVATMLFIVAVMVVQIREKLKYLNR